jgi:hypothetical protein
MSSPVGRHHSKLTDAAVNVALILIVFDPRDRIGVTLAKKAHALRARVLRERRKSLRTSAKKSSTPTRGTRQNHVIRTNHSRRAYLLPTPVGNSSQPLRPPRLCALCVEFAFPASLFIAAFAPEGRLVAQGAAPFAGPEAFSCLIFPRDVRKRQKQLSPALSALAQNASATRAESALPFLKDLNMTGINTYKKTTGWAAQEVFT